MAELQAAMQDSSRASVVLFPTDSARTFADLEQEICCRESKGVDIIVLDGTWQQARRMHKRYIVSEQQGGPLQAKLSDDCIAKLERAQIGGVSNAGHQLRRHSVTWKKVATFEATRLFLLDVAAGDGVDLSWNDDMDKYQQIANHAAIEERYGRRKVV